MNIKYLAYNLLKTDYTKLNKFVNQLHVKRKIPKRVIYEDIIFHFLKWNMLLLDYFYMRFFDTETDKSKYTNVWDMHLFHKKFNRAGASVFRNKLLFRHRFHAYFHYPYFEVKSTDDFALLVSWIKNNRSEKIVAKQPLASAGQGVKVLNIKCENDNLQIEGKNPISCLADLYNRGYSMFESFIEQHPVLKQIYPNSINTIRIVTFVNQTNEVEIWTTLVRMGFDKNVDNFSAGGLSAIIDIESGVISSGAKIKDPFDDFSYENHPLTGERITGTTIPYWGQILSMIKKAALEVPTVRTVGWDVAITPTGPTFIEGNDNWDKTIFELVSGVGLNDRIKRLLRSDA